MSDVKCQKSNDEKFDKILVNKIFVINICYEWILVYYFAFKIKFESFANKIFKVSLMLIILCLLT